MAALDDVLALIVTPVLKAAGFRRRHRRYVLAASGGMAGAVEFRRFDLPDREAFYIQYGVIAPLHRQMLRDRGFDDPSWWSPSEALLRAQVFTPPHLQYAHHDPYLWSINVNTTPQVIAPDLEQVLTGEVIPNVVEWFEPTSLAAAVEPHISGRFPGMTPFARASAMALLHAGPSSLLDSTLSRLPEDDAVRRWIETYLDDGEISRGGV